MYHPRRETHLRHTFRDTHLTLRHPSFRDLSWHTQVRHIHWSTMMESVKKEAAHSPNPSATWKVTVQIPPTTAPGKIFMGSNTNLNCFLDGSGTGKKLGLPIVTTGLSCLDCMLGFSKETITFSADTRVKTTSTPTAPKTSRTQQPAAACASTFQSTVVFLFGGRGRPSPGMKFWLWMTPEDKKLHTGASGAGSGAGGGMVVFVVVVLGPFGW